MRFRLPGRIALGLALLPVAAGAAPASRHAATACPGCRQLPIQLGSSRIVLTLKPDALPLPDAPLQRWVTEAARDVEGYLGRFPVPEVSVVVRAGGRGGIGNGRMFGDERALIRISVGQRTTEVDLANDWVATHEMVHLAFPDVGDEHLWIEEGLATYVEPLARARRGRIPVDEVWTGLVENLPKGLDDAGHGFDASDSWGSTYWGGALYWLMADVEIRERSGGRHTLADALRGILDAGGNGTASWDLVRALDTGDRATGVPVLRKLYEQLGKKPIRTDLDALWLRLGIRRTEGGIAYDDKAPLAAIRRAIAAALTPMSTASAGAAPVSGRP
jgi:hypothetical protein